MTDAHQIRTEPDIFAPFNIAQGYTVGDLVFVSGQAALNPTTGEIVGIGDFDQQAAQTFENLRAVLRAGGSDLDKIIKVTIYLKDMNQFGKIVDLRAKYFSPPYPADTIVEVSSLALPELEIEIEAVALAHGRVLAST